MTLRGRGEWAALARAWNQGIDSRLEALTARSRADASTGKVLVHPLEVKTLVRRLVESGEEEAVSLGQDVARTLGVEVDMGSEF